MSDHCHYCDEKRLRAAIESSGSYEAARVAIENYKVLVPHTLQSSEAWLWTPEDFGYGVKHHA